MGTSLVKFETCYGYIFLLGIDIFHVYEFGMKKPDEFTRCHPVIPTPSPRS
jgi:hypothetical protein